MSLEKLMQFGGKRSEFPDIAGSESGLCLVVASGHTVWDDLEQCGFTPQKERQNFDIIAINDVGMHIPSAIQHWYSNDRILLHWKDARRPDWQKLDKAYNGFKTHSCYSEGVFNYYWPWPGHGTSTLNGVYTALALGYDTVIVCGAPMDDKPHYFDPPWQITNFEKTDKKEGGGGMRFWERSQREVFDGRVYVRSGNLTKILPVWK